MISVKKNFPTTFFRASNTVYGPEASFVGWNLVGTPFPTTAYIADNRPFYTMNGDGSKIIGATSNSFEAMEAVFVEAQ